MSMTFLNSSSSSAATRWSFQLAPPGASGISTAPTKTVISISAAPWDTRPRRLWAWPLSLSDEKVVMFDAEGALLMNLGILATIAGKAPQNFYHFVLDNECYATTGGQPVPNAQNINYAGMAKEAGYAAAYSFDNMDDIVENLEEILHQTGPVFIAVKVIPLVENEPIGRRKRMPLPTRAASVKALQEELGITNG